MAHYVEMRVEVNCFRWLFKNKHVVDGNIVKFMVWFVVRGFSQKEGVDYEETFVLVTRYTSIRFVMSIFLIMGRQHFLMRPLRKKCT